MTQFPARVHVIFARAADYAIVLRRGPSKSVCTIGWNRKNDHFEIGQWLHGRIDERSSDLSPDGKHFIYAANRGRARGEVEASWTAISRSPYLKAIGLWTGLQPIGGLFVNDTDYWLWPSMNYGLGRELQRPAGLSEHLDPPLEIPNVWPAIYYMRLKRDGWKLLSDTNVELDEQLVVFRKPLPFGWFLEKRMHVTLDRQEGKSIPYDTHRLTHPVLDSVLNFPAWEWADLDRDRLVWSEMGLLKSATMMRDGPNFIKEIHDFNDLSFKPIQAPY